MQSEFNADDDDEEQYQGLSEQQSNRKGLFIKIRRPMVHAVETSLPLRRSTRHRNSNGSIQQQSGSEFSAANASGSVSGSSENDPKAVNGAVRRSSRRAKREIIDDEEQVEDLDTVPPLYTTRSGRTTKAATYTETSDKEVDLFQSDFDVEVVHPRGRGAKQVIDSDEDVVGRSSRYATRSRSRKVNGDAHGDEEEPQLETTSNRTRRLTRRTARKQQEDDGYVDDPDADADGSTDPEEMDFDAPETSPSPEPGAGAEHDDDGGGKTYSFRRRTKQINYAIPPPLEEVRPTKGATRPKGKGRAGPGWSANGTELGRYMGLAGDDSVSVM